ncbi:MAG: RidA family protein [Rhodospirillales bacterium]|nr:RidA family protein [Rhodospirillales bacterium]
MLKAFNPKTIAPPQGKYQMAIEIPAGARTLHISGQVGVLPDGKMAQGFDAQADAVWSNLKAILADAGMTFDDLVKVTIILVDKAHIGPSRDARERNLGSARRPASTLLVIPALASPDYLIEIEAVAAKA